MKKIVLGIAAAAMTASIALSAGQATASPGSPGVNLTLPTIQTSKDAEASIQQVGYRYTYRCYYVRYGYRTYYRCFYRYYYY